MHLQISGSPGDTASNMRAIVFALQDAGVNIEGIGPDVNPPHVRVAVRHGEPYKPDDENDPFNKALAAMEKAGLAPTIKPAVTVTMPNKVGALHAALNRLVREGYASDSVLVLAGGSDVQIGVANTILKGWDKESDRVERLIADDLSKL